MLVSLEQKLTHLGGFRDLQCAVHIQLAEPLRASWSEDKKLEGPKAISQVDGLELTWRASPTTCRLTGYREVKTKSSAFVSPLVQQVDRALCIWMQSFYVESPVNLQVAPFDKWEQRRDKWIMPGRGGRYLEVSAEAQQVKAVMGPDQELRADYAAVSSRWLPDKIQFRAPTGFGEIADIRYLPPYEGAVFPESFWLRVGESEKDSRAVAKVQVSMCKLRRTEIQESAR